MRFKKIVPYFVTFATLLIGSGLNDNNTDAKDYDFNGVKPTYASTFHLTSEYDLRKSAAEDKATALITKYIDNAVSGAQRILDMRKSKGYNRAVQTELPGAPRNETQGTLHCLYAQYTQLERALAELNDSIKIIPTTENTHQAGRSFVRNMTKLYDKPEYNNAIHRGHVYQSDSAYNHALNRYLYNATRGKRGNIDSLRTEYTKKFQQKNFSAGVLNPGTILIVNGGHAIMYLGQGFVQNNEFIPDANGRAVCCSYNREHPATYLTTYSTQNAFAADIKKIATVEYYKDIERIDSLNRTELLSYLSQYLPHTDSTLQTRSTPMLRSIAQMNYTNRFIESMNQNNFDNIAVNTNYLPQTDMIKQRDVHIR